MNYLYWKHILPSKTIVTVLPIKTLVLDIFDDIFVFLSPLSERYEEKRVTTKPCQSV